ncbi:MAG: nucleotidyltransferase domain-containing protein [Oligoflexia bacterium]|nr:nucleotidyltransferase domain-containing protein [Oligoflexia bacterium]
MRDDKYFGLTSVERELIISLIKQELFPDQKLKIWIFGSRARRDNQRYSDVDLLLEIDPPSTLTTEQFVKMQSNLEESYIQYKVDLVCSSTIEESYRENIERDKVLF